jgi:hypothetical protein
MKVIWFLSFEVKAVSLLNQKGLLEGIKCVFVVFGCQMEYTNALSNASSKYGSHTI